MKKVLLIGARGFLGSQVLDAILKSKVKYDVRALIREGSNASETEALGVTILRGDMMKPESLEAACEGVDVVINTANGYSQRHPEIDTEGAKNVVDAVKKMGVKRYIYCSVLTCDKAPDVDHFWNKKLAEDYMKEQDVPYIALRPGGFLDQVQDFLGDGLKKGSSFAICPWDKTVPIGMIFTPDLAKLFAASIELPSGADRTAIDVGWTRPVAYQEVVAIAASKFGLEGKVSVYSIHWTIRNFLIYTVGWFRELEKEMLRMFNYFDTGKYVNETSAQMKFFGEVPTPEDVIGRYVETLASD